MKIRLIIILLLIVTCVESYAQKLQKYYPDGKKYMGKANTIGELNKELEEKGRVYYHLFTNKPLWVETADSTKIDSAINSFNLKVFFESSEFERLLEQNVEKKTLTKNFIIETLGQPDKKTQFIENSINMENWTYTTLGVTLKLKAENIISYRKNTDSIFMDSVAIVAKYKECCDLKTGYYYWLSQNYCHFKSKEGKNQILFCGRENSKFQVLYQLDDLAFIKFKSVSTAFSLRQDTIKIKEWPGAEISNSPLVNVTDTFTVNVKDFSILYYSDIGNESYCDYILKGKIASKLKKPYSNLSFLLIIDEGYKGKDSLLLQTDKNGEYEFSGDSRTGFICFTGVSKEKRHAYYVQHKYITFTIIANGKAVSKKMKAGKLFGNKPIKFDVLVD